MRLRSGLAISFSFALAAAIAFACSSFEASEVPPDGGTEATHGPDATDVAPAQDGGVDVPPRRWCADQDATFCDDFDELDASFESHWHEVELTIDGGVVERDDRTWRSFPFSVRMEATSPEDGGLAVARLVKTVAPTKAIEVAFDMYVVHVGAGGAAPLGIKCAGPSEERIYALFVTVASPSASEFGMHFADGDYFLLPGVFEQALAEVLEARLPPARSDGAEEAVPRVGRPDHRSHPSVGPASPRGERSDFVLRLPGRLRHRDEREHPTRQRDHPDALIRPPMAHAGQVATITR